MTKTDAKVDAWFEDCDLPVKDALVRVRQIIRAADPRVEECIKWRMPTFTFKGNIVSFNPAKEFVSLMFHSGAEIPGDHPRLKGDAKRGRTMRFQDLDEVEEGKEDLEAVIRAWCAWKE